MKTIPGEAISETKSVTVPSSEGRTHHPSREISIWIDSYDDIFSDFDPRHLSERNISDDFLYEVKKVSLESDFHISELKLLVPGKNRSAENEDIIIKRLQTHFRKNHHYFVEQIKFQNKRGLLFTLAGLLMMSAASYVSSLNWESFFKHALIILLEPAGWFLVWAGLDHLIYSSREKKPELDFYNKMSKCKIIFVSI